MISAMRLKILGQNNLRWRGMIIHPLSQKAESRSAKDALPSGCSVRDKKGRQCNEVYGSLKILQGDKVYSMRQGSLSSIVGQDLNTDPDRSLHELRIYTQKKVVCSARSDAGQYQGSPKNRSKN